MDWIKNSKYGMKPLAYRSVAVFYDSQWHQGFITEDKDWHIPSLNIRVNDDEVSHWAYVEAPGGEK